MGLLTTAATILSLVLIPVLVALIGRGRRRESHYDEVLKAIEVMKFLDGREGMESARVEVELDIERIIEHESTVATPRLFSSLLGLFVLVGLLAFLVWGALKVVYQPSQIYILRFLGAGPDQRLAIIEQSSLVVWIVVSVAVIVIVVLGIIKEKLDEAGL
jgi:Na+/melibiose symporter-like transporter